MKRFLGIILALTVAGHTFAGPVTLLGAGSSGVSYLPAANTLFAAMTSSPDATRKGLINTAIGCLQTAGVWTKEDWLTVMAAGNSHDGLLNWFNPSKTMSTGGSMTFTTDRGFKPASVSASNFLTTSENLDVGGSNVYAQDSAHFSAYLNGFAFQSGAGVIATSAANYNTGLGQQTGANSFNASINTTAITMTTGVDSTPSHFLGAWTVSRTGQFAQALYKAGTAINGVNSWTDASASTVVPNTPATPLGVNSLSATWNPPSASDQLAYYSSGSGFSSTDAANEASCMLVYLTAIGAN